jgi:hypothetical protein
MLTRPAIATHPARPARTPTQRRHGLAASAQRIAVELTPQAVEQIATRVAQLLRHQQQHDAEHATEPSGLLNVSQLANHFNLSRAWVYEHADQLGAIRFGDGPKARLRFDLNTATQALERNQRQAPAPAARRKPRSAPARPEPYPTDAPLLKVRNPYERGVRSCVGRTRARGRLGVI